MAICSTQHVSIPSFLPSACSEVSYAPGLLLDAGFDASIIDHPEFSMGCRGGFEDYFGAMYDNDAAGYEVFVYRLYGWSEVERMVVENIVRRYNAFEKHFGVTPLSWRAGFVLGWLSALALVDSPLALQGLHLLLLLVPSCQYEEARGITC